MIKNGKDKHIRELSIEIRTEKKPKTFVMFKKKLTDLFRRLNVGRHVLITLSLSVDSSLRSFHRQRERVLQSISSTFEAENFCFK